MDKTKYSTIWRKAENIVTEEFNCHHFLVELSKFVDSENAYKDAEKIYRDFIETVIYDCSYFCIKLLNSLFLKRVKFICHQKLRRILKMLLKMKRDQVNNKISFISSIIYY